MFSLEDCTAWVGVGGKVGETIGSGLGDVGVAEGATTAGAGTVGGTESVLEAITTGSPPEPIPPGAAESERVQARIAMPKETPNASQARSRAANPSCGRPSARDLVDREAAGAGFQVDSISTQSSVIG